MKGCARCLAQSWHSGCLQEVPATSGQILTEVESTAWSLKWFGAPGKACQEEDRAEGGNRGKVVLSMHTKEHHLNFPVLNMHETS